MIRRGDRVLIRLSDRHGNRHFHTRQLRQALHKAVAVKHLAVLQLRQLTHLSNFVLRQKLSKKQGKFQSAGTSPFPKLEVTEQIYYKGYSLWCNFTAMMCLHPVSTSHPA